MTKMQPMEIDKLLNKVFKKGGIGVINKLKHFKIGGI